MDGKAKRVGSNTRPATSYRHSYLKPKDLIGIPWRTALALQKDGWYLRSDIIWAKPNQLPESVTDRCTKSHEYVFLLTKNKKYYYDTDAIKEPYASSTIDRISQDLTNQKGTMRANGGAKTNGPLKALGNLPEEEPGYKNWKLEVSHKQDKYVAGESKNLSGHSGYYDRNGNLIGSGMKNKRDVWWISLQPYKGSHFATMPEKLIEPCILAGSKEKDIILDPFGGSGTVAKVASTHGRNFILLELNKSYVDLMTKRLGEDQKGFFPRSYTVEEVDET